MLAFNALKVKEIFRNFLRFFQIYISNLYYILLYIRKYTTRSAFAYLFVMKSRNSFFPFYAAKKR